MLTTSLHRLVAALVLCLALPGHASNINDPAAVPHLDKRGQAAYRQFLSATPSRAFAIAPGGTWGWSADADGPEQAERDALANCQANTRQACMIYARDKEIVLDAAKWARAWGPYKSRAEAGRAGTGIKRGERFPDLAFRDARGRPVKLSDLRGQVVMLHFWGSWCPPCQHEMPDLARLAASLKQEKGIRFVFMQVGEDFRTASQWAMRIDRQLPLYDSGKKQGSDAFLKLAGGGRIGDREIAAVFPTTHVVDKHGIVIFSHVGPVADWGQYRDFLRDAASRSGR
jgi:thiol-disulfide isomerase/thioredoxin